MVETATLLPFASILFLIVVELSGRAVNTDLEVLAKTKEGYILGYVPNLGFLSIVHIINVFVLMAGHLIVAIEFLTGDDVIVTLLYLGTLVFLIIVPYIEIEEYDLLLERSGAKRSWNAHFLMAALIFFEPYLFIGFGILPLGPYTESIGVAVFFLTFALGTTFFLDRLRTELRTSGGVKEVIDETAEGA